jgi:lysophospholipase L1-like esterase
LAISFALLLSTSRPARAADDAAAAAPKPPPFAEEIKKFEAADAKAPPAKGGVLFVGSSSIRMWKNLAGDFPGVAVINRGFGGSQVRHSTMYADRIVLPYEPKTIVFYAGDNDLAANRSPEQVLADYKAFVERVHAKLPDTHIYFISIKPSKARWKLIDNIREANRLVKEFSESQPEKLGFIDVFPAMLNAEGKPRDELLGPDGLHMTRAGYELWRDTIAPVLKPRR